MTQGERVEKKDAERERVRGARCYSSEELKVL
jgi:hypothetical protein